MVAKLPACDHFTSTTCKRLLNSREKEWGICGVYCKKKRERGKERRKKRVVYKVEMEKVNWINRNSFLGKPSVE